MICLNLGCGLEAPEGWVNLDGSVGLCLSQWGFKTGTPWPKNVRYADLRKRLPYGDASVDVIYASHLLEHFRRDTAASFLNECRRVLKKDGVCRIVVPDLKGLAEKYSAGELNADSLMQALNLGEEAEHPSFLRKIYYAWSGHPHRHKWLYDETSLSEALKKAGFARVQPKKIFESAILDIRAVERPERVGAGVGIVVEAYA